MTEDQKQTLERELWNIANDLRGKMNADEFKDYILGFIFYKYLSEKQDQYAQKRLKREDVKNYAEVTNKNHIKQIRKGSIQKLGYFLEPEELFSAVLAKGQAPTEKKETHILDILGNVFTAIERSTQRTESEDDFNHLFEDLKLDSSKLGNTPEAINELIIRIMSRLDRINFGLDESNSDILGDAYEYLISQFASGAGKKAGEFYTPSRSPKSLPKL